MLRHMVMFARIACQPAAHAVASSQEDFDDLMAQAREHLGASAVPEGRP